MDIEKMSQVIGLDVSAFVEQKNGLTYLSWAIAWREFIKIYPDATYTVSKDEQGRCYFGDPDIGYMTYTTVTADGITREMWLPVMDGANKAMKKEAYTYSTKYKDKSVEAMSMFDVNKTVMRCLTKNLAMFGLGLYIYAGEDLPQAQPTNIDCNELITLGTQKGKSAKIIEKWLIANNGHGMEYITKLELDTAVEYFKSLEDK